MTVTLNPGGTVAHLRGWAAAGLAVLSGSLLMAGALGATWAAQRRAVAASPRPLDARARMVVDSYTQLRWSLLIGGCVAIALVAVVTFLTAGGRRRAVELAAAAGSDLRAAQRRGREQADLLAAILDTVPDAIGVVEHDGRALLHNPAAIRLLGVGISDGNAAGYQQHHGLYEPDGVTPLATAHNPVLLALSGQNCDNVELVVRNEHCRTPVVINASARPVTDDRGLHAAVVVFHDVTAARRSQDVISASRIEMTRARDELAECRRRLDALLSNAGAAICLKDLDGRYLVVNEAFAALVGLPVEELAGRRDRELAEPGFLEQVWQQQDVLSSGRPTTVRVEATDREYSLTIFPLLDDHRQVHGLGAIGLDVTELGATRKELQATHARYADLAEHGSVPLAVVGLDDPEFPLRYVSPAAAHLYGASTPEEVLGTMLLAWLPGDARQAVQQRVRAISGGAPGRWQMPIVRLDGQARVIDARAVATQFEGRPAVQLELHDITEQAVVEDALRLSEERIRASFAQAPVGQFEATPDSVIVSANARLEEMLGYGPGELIGRHVFDLVPPKERPAQIEDLQRLTGAEVDHVEARRLMRRRDGSLLPAVLAANLVHDAAGVPHGYVGMLLDVSEREQADAGAAAAERMLTASQRLANVGSWEVDPATGELTGSAQLHAILGTTAHDLARVPDLLAHIVIDDRHSFVGAMTRAQGRGGTWTAEGRLAPSGLARSGEAAGVALTVRCWGEYVLDEEGHPQRSWGALQDVTALRRSEHQLREARDLFAGVLEAATEQAIIAADEHGRITMFNRGAERMLGWTETEMIGRELTELLDAEEVAARAAELGVAADHQVLTSLPRTGQAETRRWTYCGVDSGRHRVLLTATAQRGPTGRVTGFITVAADITAQVRAEEAMQASEQRFRLAFDDSLIGMALIDVTSSTGGRLLRVNRSLSRLIGYPSADLIGADLASLTHPDDRAATLDALEQLSTATIGSWQTERRYRHADGHDVWCRVVMTAVHTERGEVDYCVAQLDDISASKRAEQSGDTETLHDSLTGLASRGLVLEHLTSALARAVRSQRHVALLYLDVDRFTQINDSLGHQIGDQVLAAVGERLRGCVRDGDVVGHVGGDAFAVVSSDLADPQEAAAVAQRLESGLSALFLVADHALAVTASIGIAISGGRTSAPDLMHEAVGAMYRAKEGGRARYEIADPTLQARANRQNTLEWQLREALERDELLLHYQPVFDLPSNRLVAVEALLRWQHPRRGLLRPADFLDVAEGRDLMVPVGDQVLALACLQGAKWHAVFGDQAPQLWVNVSARQLGKQARFSGQLSRRLEATGLPPSKIRLEMSERELTASQPEQSDLRSLPDLGVGLNIDNVGAGFAGMDYVHQLPLQALKIDRRYVGGLGTDRTRTAITRSVITLAKSLELTVVAEGVETAQQQQELIDLRCDLAQGYLLGRPQPAEQIDGLLTAGSVSGPAS